MITKLISRLLLAAVATSIASVGAAGAAQAVGPTGSCGGFNGCITDQYTIPHVGDAIIYGETSVPTSAKLQLSVWGDRSGPVQTLSHRAATYSHTFNPVNLQQGTEYAATLTVTASDGSQQVKKWPFRVFERTVNLTVQKIAVLRDGDSFGPGEARAGIRPMGEQHAHVVSPVVPTDAPGTIFPDRFYKGLHDREGASVVERVAEPVRRGCAVQPGHPVPTGNGSDGCGD